MIYGGRLAFRCARTPTELSFTVVMNHFVEGHVLNTTMLYFNDLPPQISNDLRLNCAIDSQLAIWRATDTAISQSKRAAQGPFGAF